MRVFWKSRRAGTGIAGRLLPKGSDGVAYAMDLTVFVHGYCGVPSPIDPSKCGMDLTDFACGYCGVAPRIDPFISRLAVLDRRLPCFHLLARPRACGVWLPRWRWEGRNARACEWCLDCLCRLAPCSSTERSAGNPRRLREVGWCP